jgi:CheY-like chemotaxis protein
VVARAGDGDEGLREVLSQSPDVITLDLEMPKMDGFTFLRILMSKRPTPVIVISSNGKRDGVFKALELGALDFISKPTQRISPELREIEAELVQKVRMVARLKVVSLAELVPRGSRRESQPPGSVTAGQVAAAASASIVAASVPALRPAAEAPLKLCVIGASTGGPPALQQIAQSLPRPLDLPIAILVGLHMPAKFTQAFAERLGRTSAWPFREARSGDALVPGRRDHHRGPRHRRRAARAHRAAADRRPLHALGRSDVRERGGGAAGGEPHGHRADRHGWRRLAWRGRRARRGRQGHRGVGRDRGHLRHARRGHPHGRRGRGAALAADRPGDRALRRCVIRS